MEQACQLIAREARRAQVPEWVNIVFPGRRHLTVRDSFFNGRYPGQWDVDIMLDRYDDKVCYLALDHLVRHTQSEPVTLDWPTLCQAVGCQLANGEALHCQLSDDAPVSEAVFVTKNALCLTIHAGSHGVACSWTVALR